MKILVLGATGLIGHSVFRALNQCQDFSVTGTARAEIQKIPSFGLHNGQLISGFDVTNASMLIKVFERMMPDQVINCIGYTKHLPYDERLYTTLNSELPHKLLNLCKQFNSRLIHISTDCVFSGKRGNYHEDDVPDANDFYGKSKILGEIFDGNAITLRTSTIGHELFTNYGLLNWFLAQQDSCEGYRNAIFSGLPTNVFAEIIKNFVIPNYKLNGLYHISAAPINKHDLLLLIAKIYKKKILINVNHDIKIDRSLNHQKFGIATGFDPAPWEDLIKSMYESYQKSI